MSARGTPRVVLVSAAFFAISGVVDAFLSLCDVAHPRTFDFAWQTAGRALLHLLLAWGLWRRIALCRSIAIVYCFAAVLTYGAALGLALAHAPFRFPPSVVVQSLYQVPSCLLLLPFLRSPNASLAFPYPLFGR